MTDADAAGDERQPLVALIEWPTTGLDPAAARQLAEQSEQLFRRVPGLLDVRFFGDFESGIHCYFQTWTDRAALDAYLNSEEMFSNRKLAEPFAAGRPTRRIFVDYSPRDG